MEFMEIIKTRRSIRKFEEREIPPDMVEKLMEAVQWSPSWANTQCWELIVIRDDNVREMLQETISPKNPATRAIVAAPLLLALCGRLKSSGYYKNEATTKFGDWFLFDLGIAAQSIALAAHAMGLGTVMVGSYHQEKAKEILQLPDDVESVILMPAGFPAQDPKPPKRRGVEDFVHYDVF